MATGAQGLTPKGQSCTAALFRRIGLYGAGRSFRRNQINPGRPIADALFKKIQQIQIAEPDTGNYNIIQVLWNMGY